MATVIKYNDYEIATAANQHTWGSAIGKWSASFRCRKNEVVQTTAISVDGTFESPGEAEENALRIAKIWIDENPGEIVNE